MTPEKLIADIKKGPLKPVYWLEGEEPFFIDQVINFAEDKLLTEAEKSFNLSVFYGRDTAWMDVLNTARRYPMFAEKQVVIIKEAQDLKGIEKLEGYVEKPLTTTVLFVAYKGKKLDGRLKMAKLIKEKAVLFSSKKLYDNALPEWTSDLVKDKGFAINKKALALLIDHIGNDLSRLSNEVDKLATNIAKGATITEDDIEKYIGISKEFNVFELQGALVRRSLPEAFRIVQYFGQNPKAAPLTLLFTSLYNFFSKVLMAYSVPSKDEKAVAAAVGVNPFFVKDYLMAASRYNFMEAEKIILLLFEYNLRQLGVNDAGTTDGDLLKEMVVKMIAPL